MRSLRSHGSSADEDDSASSSSGSDHTEIRVRGDSLASEQPPNAVLTIRSTPLTAHRSLAHVHVGEPTPAGYSLVPDDEFDPSRSETPSEAVRAALRWQATTSKYLPRRLLLAIYAVWRHWFFRFFFFVLLYCIVCVSFLCLALVYTPLGYQGTHISDMQLPAQDVAAMQAIRFSAMRAHPSGSVAAVALQHWRMIPPPMPNLDPTVPLSKPLDAAGSMLPQVPIDPEGTPPKYALGNFVIVTFASAIYYQRLLNLIGSVHTWEPTQRVVVYDLGFTQSQVVELQCVDNIEVRPFNFSLYPAHVGNLFQYHFKPLLVYDALQHADSILVLDSGIEIRQPLRSIKRILGRDGYFVAGQPNFVGRKSLTETFLQLGVARKPFDSIQFCAGGMSGFVKTAPSYKLIATQAAQCALKPQCLSPKGAGRDNHNFDQSVNSILTYKYGLHCSHERQYREMEMSRCPIRPDRFIPEEKGGVVLCIRRWHNPKPYTRLVRYNEQCRSFMDSAEFVPMAVTDGGDPDASTSAVSTSIPGGVVLRPSGLLNRDSPRAWMYSVTSRPPSIEHTQGSHLTGGNPMLECLLREHNYRPNCTREIRAHELGIQRKQKWMALTSNLDYVRALLFAGLRMPLTYVGFAVIWIVMLRRVYGEQVMREYRKPLLGLWCGGFSFLALIVAWIEGHFS